MAKILPFDGDKASAGMRLDLFTPIFFYLDWIGDISADMTRVSYFNSWRADVTGHHLTFGNAEGGAGPGPAQLMSGVIDDVKFYSNSLHGYQLTNLNLSVGEASQARESKAAADALRDRIFAGDDDVTGSSRNDNLPTFAGNDTVFAGDGHDRVESGAGRDSVSGGTGNDTLIDTQGENYLRGDEGDDSITGGADFDDINGNQGNDTASGGLGDDWVVGGKDNDLLFGDGGADLVYGNLGDDTCEGGDGNDIVRGGQQNDIVRGGAGDDFVSGDKGDDTMTGGSGADIFHTFGDAGLDWVTDFRLAEGDRVMVDPGAQYTVAQVGADTVVSMTGGGQMVLVGVQMSTLTPGWIFGA